MSEQLPDQSDPFQRLRPHDFEPPVWEALPEDVLRQLTAEDGPGIVRDPATQREFASSQELIPDYEDGSSGNSGITYYFESGGVPDILKKMPVFKRFRILYPELADSLTRKMSGNRGNAPRELHSDLFAAYRIMRHLVDKDDPYITRPDGTIDVTFLTR